MRFSILVPVYNVEKYLEQCLDSILAQTFHDYEVLLTDDGSTDRSGEICDRYAQEYPGVFRVFHKKNEGLLLTRRHALKNAVGEYIVFVDSDDYVSDKLLEVVDDTIRREACDMVIYHFYRFWDGQTELTSPAIPFKDGTVFTGEGKRALYEEYVLRHTFVNMWVKAIRRDIIDIDIDYSALNVSRGEDIMQSFPLFHLARKIVYIDQKLYYYRKNPNSVTMGRKYRDFDSRLKHWQRHKEYISLWGLGDTMDAQVAAATMSIFYHFLKDIYMRKEHTLFTQGARYLMEDERFAQLCHEYDPKISPRRIRSRLVFFRRCLMQKKLPCLKGLMYISGCASRLRRKNKYE